MDILSELIDVFSSLCGRTQAPSRLRFVDFLLSFFLFSLHLLAKSKAALIYIYILNNLQGCRQRAGMKTGTELHLETGFKCVYFFYFIKCRPSFPFICSREELAGLNANVSMVANSKRQI